MCIIIIIINAQVGVTPVVKFEWDHKYYSGNLVAVHASLDFVAYALKGRFCSSTTSNSSGIVLTMWRC